MRVVGLHHVSVNVVDVEAAASFYVQKLGLRRRADRPGNLGDGAWLDVGAEQLHLIGGLPPAANGQHFALHVTDVDAAVSELRRTGVQVSGPVAIGTGYQAFLSDPSGNAIELHQAGTGIDPDR